MSDDSAFRETGIEEGNAKDDELGDEIAVSTQRDHQDVSKILAQSSNGERRE